MVYSIGIDLGTTDSVACIWHQGTGVTVPIDGKPILPSAISVRPDGTVLIGQPAKARATALLGLMAHPETPRFLAR